MSKSLTEKHGTINHIIIFNYLITKFYQCSIWGFCQSISRFFSLPREKNVEVIKFLGILKNYVFKNKILFCSRKKNNFSLNKKSYFCLLHNFQTWFHNADYLQYYPQMSMFSFHTFLFSYVSLLKMEHRNNANLFLFIQLGKVNNNKMNEKRSHEYQSRDPEYVTGQINSRILELLLRQFCCLIFVSSQKF